MLPDMEQIRAKTFRQTQPARLWPLATLLCVGCILISRPFAAARMVQQAEWTSLFDGKSLTDWKSTAFGGEGEVHVKEGNIFLERGSTLTGITWSGRELPRMNYEISLEAKKLAGNDFFCALTFPVEDSHCSLIVGGWGGGVVGLSSIDGLDASENETSRTMDFPHGRWYQIRVRITNAGIAAWIDDEQVVEIVTTGRRISTRWEVDLSKPLGVASWKTQAALRDIKIRPLPSGDQQLVREIFKELVEINTTDSVGNVTAAAEAMAARLLAAGFPAEDVRVLGPHPKKGNLVARLRGSGSRQPILLLAHLDVVEARKEDWSFDPFRFHEQDGYFYGRGTSDIKSGAAILVTNFLRWKREGFRPDRDLILALTADEEGGNFNGVGWLLSNHRDLIQAAYCLNTDGGGGEIRNGKHLLNEVQTSEKVYQSFRLEVRNRGGHSSLPVKDNAIYSLARGLSRLAGFEFPVRLNETTRAYFERMSAIERGQTAEDMKLATRTPPDPEAVARLSAKPYYNALMRTTCVATELQAGHAENALPQRASAIVNCRMLPEDSPGEIQRRLINVLADETIEVVPLGMPRPSPPSPLLPEILAPLERITAELWPRVPVIPIMSTGATDGLYLRIAGIPTYGVSGVFDDVDDVRAHGKDERVAVKAFYDGLDFMYRLVGALSLPQRTGQEPNR